VDRSSYVQTIIIKVAIPLATVSSGMIFRLLPSVLILLRIRVPSYPFPDTWCNVPAENLMPSLERLKTLLSLDTTCNANTYSKFASISSCRHHWSNAGGLI